MPEVQRETRSYMDARYVRIRVRTLSISFPGAKGMNRGAGARFGAETAVGKFNASGSENCAENPGNARIAGEIPTGLVRARRLPVDCRRRGFQARAARRAAPDAEGVSSTIRGRGKCRRTAEG